MYQVKIKKLEGYEDISIPQKMSEGSSGFDLYAGVKETIVLKPNDRILIPTGLTMEIPIELEAQVRPRSGLALKQGITLLNTPGTIDADYRGEIGVIMINLGKEDFVIERGQRIAQLVFMEVPKVSLVEVNQISDTERGSGGFGHTGQ